MTVRIEQLKTPAALIDLPRLRRNASRMLRRAEQLGVRLRPHVKTHKTIEGAFVQTQAPERPITVSTIAEASYFARAGFRDITWALPVHPSRIEDVLEMTRRTDSFHVVSDDLQVVQQLDQAASRAGLTVSVFMKVDVGAGRAGVSISGARALEVANGIVGSKSLRLAGLLAHEGQAYHATGGAPQLRQIALDAAEELSRLASRLRDEGLELETVSLGSTPTAWLAPSLPGVTELRPGNYLFLDAMQVALGTCSLDDVSFSVLTTVIGVYPERKVAVVDAGALALSMDPGATHNQQAQSYGVLMTPNDGNHISSLRLARLSQEHGIIVANSPTELKHLRVGDQFRIIPNHSCLAAALFDSYSIEDSGNVLETWHPIRGWNLPTTNLTS